MTAVSLECGYPASSIRERIYAIPDVGYGVLLFTATSQNAFTGVGKNMPSKGWTKYGVTGVGKNMLSHGWAKLRHQMGGQSFIITEMGNMPTPASNFPGRPEPFHMKQNTHPCLKLSRKTRDIPYQTSCNSYCREGRSNSKNKV